MVLIKSAESNLVRPAISQASIRTENETGVIGHRHPDRDKRDQPTLLKRADNRSEKKNRFGRHPKKIQRELDDHTQPRLSHGAWNEKLMNEDDTPRDGCFRLAPEATRPPRL